MSVSMSTVADGRNRVHAVITAGRLNESAFRERAPGAPGERPRANQMPWLLSSRIMARMQVTTARLQSPMGMKKSALITDIANCQTPEDASPSSVVALPSTRASTSVASVSAHGTSCASSGAPGARASLARARPSSLLAASAGRRAEARVSAAAIRPEFGPRAPTGGFPRHPLWHPLLASTPLPHLSPAPSKSPRPP